MFKKDPAMMEKVTGFRRITNNKISYPTVFTILFMISSVLCNFYMVIVAYADNNQDSFSESSPVWQDLKDGFDYTVRVLGSGSYLKPAVSSKNPDNDFFKLKRYSADFELRADFSLIYERLELTAKPRASLIWEKLDNDNAPEGTAWRDETWVSEYRIRYGISDSLFLSYGRENLQWGPTILYSPSNPFFLKTGRANSQTELAGMGFARLVYIPDMVWTFSLIAHLDEGAHASKTEKFEKTYALKLDYNGSKGYSGMILSHQENGENSLGMFGVWTAIDNTLLYFEGELSNENKELYPSPMSRHPMGGEMAPLKENNNAYSGSLIVGGSYTFNTLITLSLEYLYNSRGYSDEEAEDYYALRKNAADAYYTNPFAGLSRQTLGMAHDNRLQYLRQNYLFFQLSRKNIRDVLDLRFILTYNVDDNSNMSILNIGYNLNDHMELYFNGTRYHGSADSEYASMFDYKYSIGFIYTF